MTTAVVSHMIWKQRQTSKWCGPNTPLSKKFRFQKSRAKTILILFFTSKGLIYHEYVAEGQTVNATFSFQVLYRLCKRIARVWSEM